MTVRMTVRLLGTLIIVAIVIIGCAMVSIFHHDRSVRRCACISNLVYLDAAKTRMKLDYGYTNGVIVSREQLLEYVNGHFPICPDGGSYDINPIDMPPKCSIVGHMLGR